MAAKAILALSAVLTGLIAGGAHAAPSARVISLGNFQSPTHVAVAPGQPELLFVVEREGIIRVLRNERRIAIPFLDIRNLVTAGGEEGLLSVAFPPNYASSGRFYVAFTNSNGDVEVDEFRRMAGNPARADRGSRRIILRVFHRGATNHNGGQLQFDANGLLYISVGDGGSGVSPPGEAARDLEDLRGKILRIRPIASGGRPYSIPASNPFVGTAGADEIFAYGLRNPFRFSFDRNRIAIGDVGQSQREEVNYLPVFEAAGANFGWPQYEGDIVFDNSRPGPDAPLFPMHTYNHNSGGCAIIGGHVVRNSNIPALNNRYIYGDACTGQLRNFIPRISDNTAVNDRSTEITLPGLSSFGVGFNGTIYTAQIGGQVSRLARP